MYLNHSRASTFNQCRRKYYWNYVHDDHGLKPEQEDDRFAVGTAVHKGMEYLALYEEDAAQKAADYYKKQRAAHWDGALLDIWQESTDLVFRMVQEYKEKEWNKHDFAIVNPEKQFSVPLGEVCWSCGQEYLSTCDLKCTKCGAKINYWVGILDLLVNRRKDGNHDRFAVLDHKTTASTPSDQFLNGFARSFQLLGYVYGAEKESGLSIREYGVNALQKAKTLGTEASELKACPTCRNGSKKKLTCQTCSQTGKVEKKIKLEPFRRKWFTVDDSDIDRFVLFGLRTIRSIDEEAQLFKTEPEMAYPMNDKVCNFGPCLYAALCWDNRNVLEWYKPSVELLAGLEPRKQDYVEDIAAEEVG